jgi:hypothetical protein
MPAAQVVGKIKTKYRYDTDCSTNVMIVKAGVEV